MDLTLSKLSNSATRLSLNERFTAIATTSQTLGHAARARARSRSRSRPRALVTPPPRNRVNPGTSIRNSLLLNKLERKHKFQAALKLKRRSLRTATGVSRQNRRTTLNNYRLLRRNGLPKNATMRADLEIAARGLRRSNSRLSLNGRTGPRRPIAGGAAIRIARRRLALAQSQDLTIRNRGRSRSRARDRRLSLSQIDLHQNHQLSRNNGLTRGRSRSRSRVRMPDPIQLRGRSRSRNRLPLATSSGLGNLRNNIRRIGIRRKSINRPNRNRVSVQDRLGFIPSNNKRPDRRGVANGRIEKRRLNRASTPGVSVRQGRDRSRAAINITRTRSRSRARNKFNNNNNNNQRKPRPQKQQQLQQRNGSGNNNMQNRSRSRSRTRQRLNGVRRLGTNNGNRNNIGGNRKNIRRLGGNKNRNQKQQQGKGRGRNPKRPNNKNRQQGQQNGGGKAETGASGSGDAVRPTTPKKEITKDDLDAELDEYMATTRSESNIYLSM